MGVRKQWLTKAIGEQEYAAEWAVHKRRIKWLTWEWVEKASDEALAAAAAPPLPKMLSDMRAPLALSSYSSPPTSSTSSAWTSLSPTSSLTSTPLVSKDLSGDFSSMQSQLIEAAPEQGSESALPEVSTAPQKEQDMSITVQTEVTPPATYYSVKFPKILGVKVIKVNRLSAG